MASRPEFTVDDVGSEERSNQNPFRRDGVGSTLSETFALNTPAIYRDGLRSSLPEGILDMILARLPPAAKCRFRCVCRSWKSMLSSSPCWPQTNRSCTIMTRLRGRDAKIFCHSEKKWYSLPSIGHPPWAGEMNWEVADVDVGLICYRCNVEGKLWLSVCNPLTQSRRIIPPNDRSWEQLKLVVDRENKTFKVLVMSGNSVLTGIYDSTTARWLIWVGHPEVHECPFRSLFVWKNVIYAHGIKQEFYDEDFVVAFDTESAKWIEVAAGFPRDESCAWMNHFILSDRGQVMLLQFYSREEPACRLWKLLDNGPSKKPDFSLSMWEKVDIGHNCEHNIDDRFVGDLAGMRLARACHGTEYIVSMFSDAKMCKQRGSKARKLADGFTTRRLADIYLKYFFTTKTWSLIPRPAGWRTASRAYTWEPSLDFDTELNIPEDEGSMEDVCSRDYSARFSYPKLEEGQFIPPDAWL